MSPEQSPSTRESYPLEPDTKSRAGAADKKGSYGQILKSSALIGGASLLNIAIGIVRTKAMAILLGPAGFGLMGLYGSIADLVRSIAQMGINSSGVRQIAEAAGSGDTERIARTVIVLRRIATVLGLLGAVFLVLWSTQVSRLTFGSDEHADAVALLSLAVFFRIVSDAQGALVQGMRRITDLAKIAVLGALFGTMGCIPLVYFFREEGVAPSLVTYAAVTALAAWWYSRKVRIPRPAMTAAQVRQEVAPLLKLGIAFMASGFITLGAAYAVRTIVLRMDGLDAAGFYSAAWTLGGLYVGIILQAMGADFYPRLVGVAQDNRECNRLVNEQAQVSLLLAGPGVIATITFAPLIIGVFYSSEFSQAVEILRWICLGIAMRVITWPMGLVIVAKNRQTLFVITDLAWALANLGLTWICVASFGVNGAGIAFFGSYVFHGLMIYPVVRWLSGFRWSARAFGSGIIFVAAIAMVFLASEFLPPLGAIGLGTVTLLLTGYYSVKSVVALVGAKRLPTPLKRALLLFRIVAAKDSS